jgi:hypothetical protein
MKRRLRPIAGATTGALCAVVISSHFAAPAQAAAEPPDTWSWYVNTTNSSTLYTLGYNQGVADKASGRDSEVVLDFGGQNEANTDTYLSKTGVTFPYATTETLVEQFASGYYVGTGSDITTILSLAVGTCNCVWVDQSLGSEWGRIVAALEGWVTTSGFGTQVHVEGADDIETWGGATGTDAKSWEAGYVQGTTLPYVDYGSLDGCPPYGACSGTGWSQSVYWSLSWGDEPALALPEIYYDSQAQEWESLALYSYNSHGGDTMGFTGPLDDYDLNSGTNTPLEAWNDLENLLVACGSKCNSTMIYQDSMHVG